MELLWEASEAGRLQVVADDAAHVEAVAADCAVVVASELGVRKLGHLHLRSEFPEVVADWIDAPVARSFAIVIEAVALVIVASSIARPEFPQPIGNVVKIAPESSFVQTLEVHEQHQAHFVGAVSARLDAEQVLVAETVAYRHDQSFGVELQDAVLESGVRIQESEYPKNQMREPPKEEEGRHCQWKQCPAKVRTADCVEENATVQEVAALAHSASNGRVRNRFAENLLVSYPFSLELRRSIVTTPLTHSTITGNLFYSFCFVWRGNRFG